VRASSVQPGNGVGKDYCRFEDFPEYRQLQEQRRQARQSGLIQRNPYFVPHEGVSANRVSISGRNLINFSGYNYLGLSGDRRVSDAAISAIQTYGTSVSASRVVSGEIPLHAELESAIANLLQVTDCAVFVSGWGTNVSTIGHLMRPGDLILHDALVHNSAMMGCMLSGARRIPYPHNDVSALARLLAENRHHHERVLIVTEGVYSMDGDMAPLPDLIALKHKYGCLLMVDEAHSMGTLGATGGGIREHFGVAGSDVDIWMGTLSKSFASCGGYIAGSAAMVDNIRYLSSGMVYSVGLPPSNAAAALTALQVLKAEPSRVTALRERSALFLTLI
jgi:7-keto-8-aminopelargonate synthetase-like enzyme